MVRELDSVILRRMSKKLLLLLRVLILSGLIIFGFILGWQYGLLELALSMDRSYLSSVILVIYAALSCHWLLIAARLSNESDSADTLKLAESALPEDISDKENLIKDLRQQLRSANSSEQAIESLDLFADRVSNRHAFGYFASDVLLRLGLLGTIIGFILMLLPVSSIREFDSSVMQQLLASMSGGMAVALYTTLTGLITSTLLRFQYYILESAAADMVYQVSLEVRRYFQTNDDAA